MSKVLTSALHQEIFNQIKSSFSDFHLFDYLVADKLKQAIIDSDNIELNMKTTKKVAERYFDVESFKTPEQKLVWTQIQLIFKACYVLILSHQETPRSLFWSSIDTLLENYPQFENIDNEELQLLLNFRNMVKVTLMVVPARLNKQCILKIAGRLEGSQNEYITGGGQKPAVTRRVEIYEKEGGITAEKRPDRNRSVKTEPSETGKRSASSFSEKKVKLVRLMTDEVKFLSKGPANPFPNMVPSSAAASARKQEEEHFMSPLSTLSMAASRMLKAADPNSNNSNALPVATAVAVGPAHSHSAAALAVPSLARETSDPINSYLMSSDSDFWKETIGTMELKQPTTIQRNVSLTFNLPDFTDQLNTLFPEALNTDGKQPLTLQRGFSLGFYSSTFSDDLRNILPMSPKE